MHKRRFKSGIYRHFKNKLYYGIAHTKKVSESELVVDNIFTTINATHTEKLITIPVYVLKDGSFVTTTDEEFAFYTALYGETGCYYLRPIEMFLSKVDKVKYPEVEQEYRLEYIA